MKLKTWHFEMAVATVLLGSVAAYRGTWLDALGALAVVLTFGHTTIAERMREKQARLPITISAGEIHNGGRVIAVPAQAVEIGQVDFVECHALLTKYLIGKEIAWVAFFLISKSYPALVGCGLFLLYPVWRKWWRRRHPLPA